MNHTYSTLVSNCWSVKLFLHRLPLGLPFGARATKVKSLEPFLAIFVVGETLLESTHNTCECTDEPISRILLDQSIGFPMQKFLLVPFATGSFEF